MASIKEISLAQIDFADKHYIFRHAFSVSDLENSIQYEGLLYSPILYSKNVEDENKKYQIVCGYRRLIACKNLGWATVPCKVYESGEITNDEMLKISIAENTKRANLLPVEIADALLRIKNELQISISQLAEQFGEVFDIGNKVEEIERYLQLNSLDENQKEFFAENANKKMEFSVANIEEKNDREAIVDFIRDNQSINRKQLDDLLHQTNEIKKQHPELKDIKSVFAENSLQNVLQDNELKGSKKIQQVLEAMKNQVEPERKQKIEQQQQLLFALHESFEAEERGLSQKIQFKKKIGESSVKIEISISNTKDLVPIAKLLYEKRKSLIAPLLRL